MTKEELKQKAEEYALEKCKECYMCNSEENGERLYCAKFESRKEGYIAGAESREKEIKSLGERCLQLQKDKGNLTDSVRDLEEKLANVDYQLEGRDLEIKELQEENKLLKNSDSLCKLIGEQKIKIAELEAQIEEMKCCYNCKHSRTEYEHCKTDKHEKWEIKEK
jgi:SMC interacting uncharacterized protein involved in chromosome segregation